MSASDLMEAFGPGSDQPQTTTAPVQGSPVDDLYSAFAPGRKPDYSALPDLGPGYASVASDGSSPQSLPEAPIGLRLGAAGLENPADKAAYLASKGNTDIQPLMDPTSFGNQFRSGIAPILNKITPDALHIDTNPHLSGNYTFTDPTGQHMKLKSTGMLPNLSDAISALPEIAGGIASTPAAVAGFAAAGPVGGALAGGAANAAVTEAGNTLLRRMGGSSDYDTSSLGDVAARVGAETAGGAIGSLLPGGGAWGNAVKAVPAATVAERVTPEAMSAIADKYGMQLSAPTMGVGSDFANALQSTPAGRKVVQAGVQRDLDQVNGLASRLVTGDLDGSGTHAVKGATKDVASNANDISEAADAWHQAYKQQAGTAYGKAVEAVGGPTVAVDTSPLTGLASEFDSLTLPTAPRQAGHETIENMFPRDLTERLAGILNDPGLKDQSVGNLIQARQDLGQYLTDAGMNNNAAAKFAWKVYNGLNDTIENGLNNAQANQAAAAAAKAGQQFDRKAFVPTAGAMYRKGNLITQNYMTHYAPHVNAVLGRLDAYGNRAGTDGRVEALVSALDRPQNVDKLNTAMRVLSSPVDLSDSNAVSASLRDVSQPALSPTPYNDAQRKLASSLLHRAATSAAQADGSLVPDALHFAAATGNSPVKGIAPDQQVWAKRLGDVLEAGRYDPGTFSGMLDDVHTLTSGAHKSFASLNRSHTTTAALHNLALGGLFHAGTSLASGHVGAAMKLAGLLGAAHLAGRALYSRPMANLAMRGLPLPSASSVGSAFGTATAPLKRAAVNSVFTPDTRR